MKLKFSGLQMKVGSDVRANEARILRGIAAAARRGSDFLVTPEGSLSGYTHRFDADEVRRAFRRVAGAAARAGVGLFLGTCYREAGARRPSNQVRVCDPSGRYLGASAKALLCSGPACGPGGEMDAYALGRPKVFEVLGRKVGALICNDLWATPGYTRLPNPYLPKMLKDAGAEMIVQVVNSGGAPRYRDFHESSLLLWSAALNLPIFSVNAAPGRGQANSQTGLVAAGRRTRSAARRGEQVLHATVRL